MEINTLIATSDYLMKGVIDRIKGRNGVEKTLQEQLEGLNIEQEQQLIRKEDEQY